MNLSPSIYSVLFGINQCLQSDTNKSPTWSFDVFWDWGSFSWTTPSLLLNSLNSSVSCIYMKSFFSLPMTVSVDLHKTTELRLLWGLFFFLKSLEMNLSRSLRGNLDSSQAWGCLCFYIAKHSNSPVWRERVWIWICLCVLTIPFSNYFWKMWLKEVNGLSTFFFVPKTKNILPCKLKP